MEQQLSPSRRIVVTGLGAVTPLGLDAGATWSAMIAGRSGLNYITHFDSSPYPFHIAAEVKGFDPTRSIDPKEARRMDRYTQFALVAAQEAMKDAQFTVAPEEAELVGCIVGSAEGGIGTLLEQQRILDTQGVRRLSPFFGPNCLCDSASGQIAIAFGAQGPNMAVVSACATGAHAIGESMETIRRGDAEVMIAGGSEAIIIPIILGAFTAMRALGTAPEGCPEKASRPFDKTRDGFIVGEGAAIMVLESLEHAQKRGAQIYAEVVGYGTGNDAYHMAAPVEAGAGAARAMRMALRKAGLQPDEIDYINAHGTSTPLNDKFETQAIKEVFGDHAYRLAVSSTKSMTGHMMGAAGAVEGFACVKAIQDGMIPPTINYEQPDPECDLDYVPNEARQTGVCAALSNSIGLGGHNSCLIFRRFEA